MIGKNEFQMIVYVCVAFNRLSQSITMFKLHFFCFGIINSGRYRQIVNQPKFKQIKNETDVHLNRLHENVQIMNLQMNKVFMLNTFGNLA